MHFAISFHLKKETHQSKFKIKTGPLFQSKEGGREGGGGRGGGRERKRRTLNSH